jgi:hypothetical protein
MTNYIPHYTKKLQAFRKKRERLRRLIHQGAGEEKIGKAAEDVRQAKIRALKAQLANPPHNLGSKDKCHRWGAKLDAEISALQTMTLEAILAEFG